VNRSRASVATSYIDANTGGEGKSPGTQQPLQIQISHARHDICR
jgi:hypothetical protein